MLSPALSRNILKSQERHDANTVPKGLLEMSLDSHPLLVILHFVETIVESLPGEGIDSAPKP